MYDKPQKRERFEEKDDRVPPVRPPISVPCATRARTPQLPSASLYARRKERTGAIVNSIEL